MFFIKSLRAYLSGKLKDLIVELCDERLLLRILSEGRLARVMHDPPLASAIEDRVAQIVRERLSNDDYLENLFPDHVFLKFIDRSQTETFLRRKFEQYMRDEFSRTDRSADLISDQALANLLRRPNSEAYLQHVSTVSAKQTLMDRDFTSSIIDDIVNFQYVNNLVSGNYNDEMMELIRNGFRNRTESSRVLHDLYIEMLSARGLAMPLALSILSQAKPAAFFSGDHIELMQGSIVSADSVIGDYTYVGYNCLVSRAFIGRYCSIANNVSIGPGEHPTNTVATSSAFMSGGYEDLTSTDCRIGSDVWIGTNAVIRRGVSIGNGAIIGANAFVNADVPDFAIVAGTPARLLRYRFGPEERSLISDAGWWDLELSEAKNTISRLAALLENARPSRESV